MPVTKVFGRTQRFADSDGVFSKVIVPLYTWAKFRDVAVSALSIERKFGNFIRVHSAYNVTSFATYLATCSSTTKINYVLWKGNLDGKETFLESAGYLSGNAGGTENSVNSITKGSMATILTRITFSESKTDIL